MNNSWISKPTSMLVFLGLILWPLAIHALDADSTASDEAFLAPREPLESQENDEEFNYFYTLLRGYAPERVLRQLEQSKLATSKKALLRGWAHHQLGHYAKALQDLESHDPHEAQIDDYLIYRWIELENTARALQDFKTMDTEHFSIRLQAGKDEVLFFLLRDVLEQAYTNLSSLFDYQVQTPIVVEVMPDYELFSWASALTKEQIETTGTVALCVENRLVMITPRRVARGYYWPDVLSHELVHFLVTRIGGPEVPLWLHEGIAKTFETRWDHQQAPALDSMLESRLAQAIQKNEFLAIEDMVPSFAALPTPELAQLAYAQTASMVDYMRTLNGEPIIRKLVSSIKESPSVEAAMKNNLGMGFHGFENAWKTWARQQGYAMHQLSARGVTLLDEDFDADALNRMDAVAEVDKKHTRLGDLLLERRRFKAALKEYEKVQASGIDMPRALLLRFLRCYQALAAHRSVLEILEKQGRHLQDDATLLKYRARALTQMQRLDEAEPQILRAMRINPFDPEIYVLWRDLLELSGRGNEIQKVNDILKTLAKDAAPVEEEEHS